MVDDTSLTAGGGRPAPAAPGRPLSETVLLVLAAMSLQAMAWAILIYVLWVHHIWYGFHDLSDTMVYLDYAGRIARGMLPYRDFPVEYPPLALPLFVLPGHGTVAAYERWFSLEMIVLCTLAGAVTTWAAASLWRGLGRPLAAAAAYAAAVLAAGAITANRYDVAVALAIAACIAFLARRHYALAGGALGVGFALKLTPLMLLPLVLVLAPRRGARLWAVAACAALAVLPFLPFMGDVHGLERVFTYHAQRPLQIESVPATPYLVAGGLGSKTVTTGNSFGSQFIAGAGTHAVATVAPWVGLLAVIGVYLLVWRRRALLRAAPQYVPLAAFACVLAFTACNKVLSPQFLVWTLPLVALVVVGEGAWQRCAGLLTVAAIFLTQVEFPARYWQVVALDPGPVALVAARNVVLVAAAVVAAVALWRLPAGNGSGVEPGAGGAEPGADAAVGTPAGDARA